jgi:hypothetical protein
MNINARFNFRSKSFSAAKRTGVRITEKGAACNDR